MTDELELGEFHPAAHIANEYVKANLTCDAAAAEINKQIKGQADGSAIQ